MSRLGTNIWVVLAMLIRAGPAHAGLVYSYSTDQSVYNVAPGGTIGVQVFLNETGLPGDPFVLGPAATACSRPACGSTIRQVQRLWS